MDRFAGVLKASHGRNNGGRPLQVAASLFFPSSKTLPVPSVNAIFFDGDRVEGNGDPVIERLSDSRNIVELLVSKLGSSANACLVDVSRLTRNLFAELCNKTSTNRHDFPASTSPTPPITIIPGLSKGRTVINQLITEFAHLNIGSLGNLMNSEKHSWKLSYEIQHCICPISKGCLLFSISKFHYVGVDLNCAGAYLTDHTVIRKIAGHLLFHNARIHLTLHGTLRQWCDFNCPWICREKDIGALA